MKFLKRLLIISVLLFIKEHFIIYPLFDIEDRDITGVYVEFRIRL